MTATPLSFEIAEAVWFKSSHSDPQGQGACVRVATNLIPVHDVVIVGDTKTPDAYLAVSPEAWSAFTSALVAGEFGGV